ncbi:HAD domain-containing protein [Cupriavidus pauculus]|uniref:Uncharacterized protein n=1 Tax=Cupriavidus pauculus TaxID=82633 RepID=A0A2N5C3P0_9BURK|nr:HAD domain-containing protein [Cupriavidus pauculus]PLP96836.1 hypothetical protein CYJ10_30045 [Cupriavidus pauculus]
MEYDERTRIFINLEGVLVPPRVGPLPDEPTSEEGLHYWRWSSAFAEMVDLFDAVLVIRSSWLLNWTLDELREKLPPALAMRMVGATDPIASLRLSGLFRVATQYEVIARYVRLHKLVNWCVVDDRSEDWPEMELWRQISPHPGMGLSDHATLAELELVLRRMAS